MGGISQLLGKPTSMREITERVAANDVLANAVDRMAGHLRANGVDIDSRRGTPLSLGPWLELDPAAERFTNSDAANDLRARTKQRDGFGVPDIETGAPRTAAAAAG
jgi:hypothetical protein